MGSSNCNYCTCLAAKFGEEKEIDHNFVILSQQDLKLNGTKYLEYKTTIDDLNKKKMLATGDELKDIKKLISALCYKGLKGITRPPYSHIPMHLHIEYMLHIALGLLCDNTNRFQRFLMERVYSYDESEYIIMSKIMTLGENISKITTEINCLEEARKCYYELSQDINYPDDKVFHLEARN